MMRLSAKGIGAAALAGAIVLGVTGVSVGKELFDRFMPQQAPVVATDQPSAADRVALQALAATPAVVTEADRNDALRINASQPFSGAPVEAARPFTAPSGTDYASALDCMTTAIYYEAGYEPTEGQRAVAQVILNRMRHPAFPKTVCGVIYQGAPNPSCQFSFACDGALARAPAPAAWRRARQVAAEALRGYVMAEVGQATHYHTDYVAPYWAPKLAKVKQIGAHIFYRWPGSWGRRAAFTGRYVGGERPFEQAVLTKATAEITPLAIDPTERRAPNDVGGRITPGLGWTPSVPRPSETGGAMAAILAGQQAAAAPAPTTTAAVTPQETEG
ncbi:MAG TPA: cell wall hydrolase [Caulobacteraceae bacterium]|nr:cell wall hydrolase [Caulobacteraceae bacterium]